MNNDEVGTCLWNFVAHASVIAAILMETSAPLQALPLKSTYETALAGKKCNKRHDQQIDCDYRIGSDLWISIAGIGLPDTSVTFMRSAFEGDFYGTYGLAHGCIIIKRGRKNNSKALEGPGSPIDFAFVSPKNGKVYRSWLQCQAGM